MRCPGCGFVTFDGPLTCKRCGRELEPRPTLSPRPSARLIEEVRAPLLGGGPSGSALWRIPRWVPLPPPPAGIEVSPPRLAGFWVRYRAFLIDAIILVGFGVIGNWLVGEVVRLGGQVGGALDFELEGLIFWGSVGFGLVTHAVYYTVFVGWRGQTPGKILSRIRIVGVDGEPVGFARAFARWLAWLASGLPFGLGYLPIPFSKSKRGLHDRLVGTMVIRLPRRKRRP